MYCRKKCFLPGENVLNWEYILQRQVRFMDQQLYPWQQECLRRWLNNRGRGIVQAVTGSGKTRLALAAAEELDKREGGRLQVKIVVPTAALMVQWARALKEIWANASEPAQPVSLEAGSESVFRSEGGFLDESGFQGEGGFLDESGFRGEGSFRDKCALRDRIGFRGGGRRTREDCKYMIYVINSARYELARQILTELKDGQKVLLIADECHRYTSGENQLIFEFLPHIKEYENHFFSLGLSATLPFGRERSYLNSVLGACIFSYGIRAALRAETVCRYNVFHVEIYLSQEELDRYRELTERMQLLYRKLAKIHSGLRDRSTGEVFEILRAMAGNKQSPSAKDARQYLNLVLLRRKIVCMAEARTECAMNLIKRLGTEQKILVFGERISQAEELYLLLQKHFPGKAGRYHSKMGATANRNTLERFRNGEIRILVTCKSLDEGVDIPDASVGIILSGTSGQRQRTQRLGRIIRKKEGKRAASLYYLHAAETAEDRCFLPEEEEIQVFDLQYKEGHFCNKIYDRSAEYAWEQMMKTEQMKQIGQTKQIERMKQIEHMKGKVLSRSAEEEILRCLKLGQVRADWLEDKEELDRQIREANGVRDKNYWICMKKVSAGSTALEAGTKQAGVNEGKEAPQTERQVK